MPYQFLFYDVFLGISALITFLLAMYGYLNRKTPGTKAFIVSMVIGSLWSIANAFELSSTILEIKLFWANLQYIAYALAPVTWLIMVFQYTGKTHWVNKKNITLLLIIPTITIILVWTDPVFGFVRDNIHLDNSGSFSVIAKDYGPWFWIHFAHCYVLNFFSVFLLLKTVLQQNLVYRAQSIFLLLGLSLIIAFNLLYISSLGPFTDYDISPIIFSISGMIIAWGIFRFRLFDLIPIARNNVIEAMENMVIVLDTKDRIVDINPATREAFPHQALVGKPLKHLSKKLANYLTTENRFELKQKVFTQLVNGTPQYYEINVSPIKDSKNLLKGWVLVITDTTDLKKTQEELFREKQELAVMAERDRMAKDLHDNLGQILSFATIQIQAAQMERQRGNHDIAEHYLERLEEIIRDAHQEMREYVYHARYSEYKNKGIEALLKKQINIFVSHSNSLTREDIHIELKDYHLSTNIKVHLVHIVKEALNNIMKHAKASIVKLSLNAINDTYKLVIEDNGIGFSESQETKNKKTSSGLDIMHERAQLLGGNLEINSIIGKMTRITVTFPNKQGGN